MPRLKIRHGLGSLILALAINAGVYGVDVVVLTTGETLRGEVIDQSPERVILRHPVLGELTIPTDSIESVLLGVTELTPASDELPPAPSTEPTPAAAPVPIPEPESLPEEKPKEKAWKTHLDFGATATTGTTDDSNIRVAGKSIWTRTMNVITLDSSYIYSVSNGDRSENRLTAGVLSEWPRPDSRWSIFAQARYDYDEFNTWTSRVTAGAGLAYAVFDVNEPVPGSDHERVFQLKLRGGAGFAREFGSSNKDIQPEAILGADLLWQLNSWQDLTASTTLFPNLDDLGEFRLVSKVEWSLKLNTLDGINLKLGLAHEHQSQVDPGNSHDELSVYAAVGIDF